MPRISPALVIGIPGSTFGKGIPDVINLQLCCITHVTLCKPLQTFFTTPHFITVFMSSGTGFPVRVYCGMEVGLCHGLHVCVVISDHMKQTGLVGGSR